MLKTKLSQCTVLTIIVAFVFTVIFSPVCFVRAKSYESPSFYADITPYTNRPAKPDNWANSKISLSKAWEINSGSSNVVIGVIDSGIKVISSLSGKVDSSLSKAFAGGSALSDTIGHGTAVASVIAGKGNSYVEHGVCKSVTLASLKVDGSNGRVDTYAVIDAINYATEKNIPILNVSLGGFRNYSELREAIENYPGLIVSGAGNDGHNLAEEKVYLPCYDYNNILVVGASTKDDKLLVNSEEPSNYGATYVDLFAPGDDIPVTTIEGVYGLCDGSSSAAAFVSGVAALILSANPGMSALQVKQLIMDNVDLVSALNGKCVTGGRLNAYKALSGHVHAYTRFSPNGTSLVNHIATCSICGQTKLEAHSWILVNGVNMCKCGQSAGYTPIIGY